MNIEGKAEKIVYGIVFIFVAILLIANLAPTAQSAGDDINDTDLPLKDLFSADGVVFILMMVGALIGLIGIAMKIGKGKRG